MIQGYTVSILLSKNVMVYYFVFKLIKAWIECIIYMYILRKQIKSLNEVYRVVGCGIYGHKQQDVVFWSQKLWYVGYLGQNKYGVGFLKQCGLWNFIIQTKPNFLQQMIGVMCFFTINLQLYRSSLSNVKIIYRSKRNFFFLGLQ